MPAICPGIGFVCTRFVLDTMPPIALDRIREVETCMLLVAVGCVPNVPLPPTIMIFISSSMIVVGNW